MSTYLTRYPHIYPKTQMKGAFLPLAFPVSPSLKRIVLSFAVLCNFQELLSLIVIFLPFHNYHSNVSTLFLCGLADISIYDI